ncbi:MAG TPA: hypothetical protein PKJ99_17500 [Thermoanaerobaculales bacterium]|nr:hypothetical protein [Thermoanaerobaculales bacterium]HQL29562.1 hypothetical protein [Thermoanaerobaculales bacterium]HQN97379.1 hypothetical protein [Thermoanaerobaculales bacterium]HQP44462.1 hypothetical protein [Thermoanaerobaculales bacterium]
MTSHPGPTPVRHALRVMAVIAVATAVALPLAAGGKKGKKDKPEELPVCWQDMKRIFDREPSAADRGFAFAYVETTLRAQWDAATGLEEEPCYPDGRRPISLHTSDGPDGSLFLANGCQRGPGFVILASDLVPGELVIKELPYSIRGMDFYLTLPEPIRFVVAPSSAVFVGAFRIAAGPLYPYDPHPAQPPTVTQQTLDQPNAAELAAELAPIFDQRWRSHLEAIITPAGQPSAPR